MQLDRDPTVDVDELALIKKALAQQLLEAHMNHQVHPAPRTSDHDAEGNRDPQTNFAPPATAKPQASCVEPAEDSAHSQLLVSSLAAVSAARLLTVSANASLVEVAALLSSEQSSFAVVCDPLGAALGVITESMLIQQLGLANSNLFAARAQEVMNSEFTACGPNDSLARVLAVMHAQALLHMPVVDAAQRPLGVVAASDAMTAVLAAGSCEDALLRDCMRAVADREG